MSRRSVYLTVVADAGGRAMVGLEAFVLSQVGEGSRIEDVAEMAGLEVDELLRVARRLSELGVLRIEDGRSRSRTSLRAPKDGRSPVSTPESVAARAGSATSSGRSSGSHRGVKTGGLSAGIVPGSVPRRRRDADLHALPIGPRDGFLLFQVDDATTVAELAEIAQLSFEALCEALKRLEAVGAIELPRPAKRASQSLSKTASVEDKPPREPLAAPGPARAAPRPTLTDSERALIAEMAARVDVPNHYEALGVARDADAKTIRRAYHALAAQAHPDRFFGRDLAACKRPLEGIFDRITKAYDVLSRAAERRAYDATLGPMPNSPGRRPSGSHGRKSSRKMEAARRSSSRMEKASPRPARPSQTSSRAATPKPAAGTEAPPAATNVRDGPVAASKGSAARPQPAAAIAQPAASPAAASRSRTPPSRRTARDHAGVFVAAAKEALARGDVVGAAAHYRLAAQCTGDPQIHAALAEADAQARRSVHRTSLEQARAAEGAGHWAEAATKYVKAYGALPEAWVAERAASAMRHDGKELKAAARLAEQAVLAEPHNAAYRVTLGEIYCDAGLMNRAQGEATRASALAPDDARVHAFVRRVEKLRCG